MNKTTRQQKRIFLLFIITLAANAEHPIILTNSDATLLSEEPKIGAATNPDSSLLAVNINPPATLANPKQPETSKLTSVTTTNPDSSLSTAIQQPPSKKAISSTEAILNEAESLLLQNIITQTNIKLTKEAADIYLKLANILHSDQEKAKKIIAEINYKDSAEALKNLLWTNAVKSYVGNEDNIKEFIKIEGLTSGISLMAEQALAELNAKKTQKEPVPKVTSEDASAISAQPTNKTNANQIGANNAIVVEAKIESEIIETDLLTKALKPLISDIEKAVASKQNNLLSNQNSENPDDNLSNSFRGKILEIKAMKGFTDPSSGIFGPITKNHSLLNDLFDLSEKLPKNHNFFKTATETLNSFLKSEKIVSTEAETLILDVKKALKDVMINSVNDIYALYNKLSNFSPALKEVSTIFSNIQNLKNTNLNTIIFHVFKDFLQNYIKQFNEPLVNNESDIVSIKNLLQDIFPNYTKKVLANAFNPITRMFANEPVWDKIRKFTEALQPSDDLSKQWMQFENFLKNADYAKKKKLLEKSYALLNKSENFSYGNLYNTSKKSPYGSKNSGFSYDFNTSEKSPYASNKPSYKKGQESSFFMQNENTQTQPSATKIPWKTPKQNILFQDAIRSVSFKLNIKPMQGTLLAFFQKLPMKEQKRPFHSPYDVNLFISNLINSTSMSEIRYAFLPYLINKNCNQGGNFSCTV